MNIETKKINVGIGFVTGRKNFKNVVKSYLNNWNESGLLDRRKYALHLLIAYDLKYSSTAISDYKISEVEILGLVDSAHYLGNAAIANEARELVEKKAVTTKEAKLIFGEGYAMKRNAVLYFALKSKMDYLVFFDDDEYPIANIRMGSSLVWKGQEVLATHIQNLHYADMTNGYHCGYISPIPQFEFNSVFSETDFKIFIESISNEIVTWDSVRKKMDDGGVSFAKPDIIESGEIKEVNEVGGMKFISGSNLGFCLKKPDKIFPFYNPPGARGEDTFLSTCIGKCNILRVPCYTFHDCYSTCQSLLSGSLPIKFRMMNVNSSVVYKRFLKAAIGWIRYKPLLLYITQQDRYKQEIVIIRENLEAVIPKLCAYFKNDDFTAIIKELDFYHAHVKQHFNDLENTKSAWLKLTNNLKINYGTVKTSKVGVV